MLDEQSLKWIFEVIQKSFLLFYPIEKQQSLFRLSLLEHKSPLKQIFGLLFDFDLKFSDCSMWEDGGKKLLNGSLVLVLYFGGMQKDFMLTV